MTKQAFKSLVLPTKGKLYRLALRILNSRQETEDMMRLGGGRNIESTLNGGGVEMEFKSIRGFVDLSWPSGKPADIDIKTLSGEVFY